MLFSYAQITCLFLGLTDDGSLTLMRRDMGCHVLSMGSVEHILHLHLTKPVNGDHITEVSFYFWPSVLRLTALTHTRARTLVFSIISTLE